MDVTFAREVKTRTDMATRTGNTLTVLWIQLVDIFLAEFFDIPLKSKIVTKGGPYTEELMKFCIPWKYKNEHSG